MDSSVFVIAAGKRDYIVPGFKRIPIHELENTKDVCNCPICSSRSVQQIAASRKYLSLHNIWALWSELQQTKCAIKEKELEKYLEKRFARTPWAKSAFEYAKRRLRFGPVGG